MDGNLIKKRVGLSIFQPSVRLPRLNQRAQPIVPIARLLDPGRRNAPIDVDRVLRKTGWTSWDALNA